MLCILNINKLVNYIVFFSIYKRATKGTVSLTQSTA